MATCSNCKNDFLDSYDYCPKCGTRMNKSTSLSCARCGAQNPNDSQFCQNCGSSLSVRESAQLSVKSPSSSNTITISEKRTSGFAIASLVLGILGWTFIPIVSSIIAIIFGAIGISRTKPGSNIQGRGMAIAGLVLGSVALFIGIIIIAVIIFLAIAFSQA